MNLINKGSNQVVVNLGSRDVLFSYNTAVAYRENGEYFVTDKFWSVTTSKHINKFVNGAEAVKVSQNTLNSL